MKLYGKGKVLYHDYACKMVTAYQKECRTCRGVGLSGGDTCPTCNGHRWHWSDERGNCFEAYTLKPFYF